MWTQDPIRPRFITFAATHIETMYYHVFRPLLHTYFNGEDFSVYANGWIHEPRARHFAHDYGVPLFIFSKGKHVKRYCISLDKTENTRRTYTRTLSDAIHTVGHRRIPL